MKYNTICPECGISDRMSETYVGIPNDILKKYKGSDAMLQVLIDYKDGKLSESELREKIEYNRNYVR